MPVGHSYVGWPDYLAIALYEDTEHVGVMPHSFNPNPYILSVAAFMTSLSSLLDLFLFFPHLNMNIYKLRDVCFHVAHSRKT